MSAICARSKPFSCSAIRFPGADKGSITMSGIPQVPSLMGVIPNFGPLAPAAEYMVDAAQRNVLFWDVMRQRGNQYREHLAETAPHVLDYEVELVMDGRQFDRPVNYGLAPGLPAQGGGVRLGRPPLSLVGAAPGPG